jgi:hypothetical protein
MKQARMALVAALAVAGVGILFTFRALEARPGRLTGQDYFEIQQLMFRYGQAIDTCANNGYDYADLYTKDGRFIDNFTEEGFKKGGLLRAEGREALARAAGGGTLGCKDVGWKDWSHLMINPVITASPEGATGRVYLVVIGEKGPNHVQRFGGYEDLYVRTPEGWRIRQRTHVRTKAWHNPLLRSPDLN